MTHSATLVVRLGAMGDILHALPAAASLKRSFPERRLIWITAPKWMPLLEGNPAVDEVIPFHRRGIRTLVASWRRLRQIHPKLAVDFQGLIQSALVGRATGPQVFYGFHRAAAREPAAAWFYSRSIRPVASHVVDRNLELAAAAGAFALSTECPLPPGSAEGPLPPGPFVLASPFAGWVGKQWPLENYAALATALKHEGLTLVVNVPPDRARDIEGVHVHTSSLAGLIFATRRATAVIGLDSGPMHLAAALGKPGVALFGPTDPARNGPYGGSLSVLRAPGVVTSYKREDTIHPSMSALRVEDVLQSLRASIAARAVS